MPPEKLYSRSQDRPNGNIVPTSLIETNFLEYLAEPPPDAELNLASPAAGCRQPPRATVMASISPGVTSASIYRPLILN